MNIGLPNTYPPDRFASGYRDRCSEGYDFCFYTMPTRRALGILEEASLVPNRTRLLHSSSSVLYRSLGDSDSMKPIKLLRKKAKLGDQGFPRATLAFYGPDDKKATKAVLGIFLREGDEPTIHRYFSEDKDARYKIDIQESILARLKEHEVRSLIMVEKIFGCPHEEEIDYPEGEACPHCPFWKGRDRYAAL